MYFLGPRKALFTLHLTEAHLFPEMTRSSTGRLHPVNATHFGHGTLSVHCPSHCNPFQLIADCTIDNTLRRAAIFRSSGGKTDEEGDRMRASGVVVSYQQGTGDGCACEWPLRTV